MKQVEINTNRLTLRPFSDNDSPIVKELAGNPRVSKTTRNIPYPYENGMAESWIESNRLMALSGTGLIYAVELKKEKTLIGSVGLTKINNSEAELGYCIGEKYWDNGYCTEATSALVKFVFEYMDINKITAEYLSSNPASGSVMRKLGMKHVNTSQKECRKGEVSSVETYETVRT